MYPNSTNQKSPSRGCLMWTCTDSILSCVRGCLWWHCDSRTTESAHHSECFSFCSAPWTEPDWGRSRSTATGMSCSLYTAAQTDFQIQQEPIICHLYSSQQQGGPYFLQQQLGGRPRCSTVQRAMLNLASEVIPVLCWSFKVCKVKKYLCSTDGCQKLIETDYSSQSSIHIENILQKALIHHTNFICSHYYVLPFLYSSTYEFQL